MEMLQENSLCSYLKQKMSFFVIYKTKEQKVRTGPALGGCTSGRGRKREKGMGG
jgi:hypothetical protein